MSGRARLGRGLEALLGDYIQDTGVARREGAAGPAEIAVRAIAPNPLQPRRAFRSEELTELAASIKANGLLQPIVVRLSASRRSYELVAGERRLRAVKQLGWTDIPAQVRDVDDRSLLVLALVENLQREELGPLEECQGYQKLRETFGYTQQEIADAVGKSRSTIANVMRLAALPPSVRRLMDEDALTMGHGRAILAVEDPIQAADLAREAVAGDWSVRETEQRVRELLERGTRNDQPHTEDKPKSDPVLGALEEALGDHLGTRVQIQWKGEGKGAIRISFQGARDLERVFAAVTGREAGEVVE